MGILFVNVTPNGAKHWQYTRQVNLASHPSEYFNQYHDKTNTRARAMGETFLNEIQKILDDDQRGQN
jgi:hypothetical protein